jgi:hypothetical protein
MRFRVYHALHAIPAPKFRGLAFAAIILAGLALIGTALVLAPASPR